MPKTVKTQSAAEVLLKYIDDYQTNPFALSKSLNVAYQTVTHIIQGKSRITTPMALRLAKHFGNTAKFWLDTQSSSEIDKLSTDKKFTAEINKIPKAEKSKGGSKTGKKKSAGKTETSKKTAKAKSGKKVKKLKTAKAKK